MRTTLAAPVATLILVASASVRADDSPGAAPPRAVSPSAAAPDAPAASPESGESLDSPRASRAQQIRRLNEQVRKQRSELDEQREAIAKLTADMAKLSASGAASAQSPTGAASGGSSPDVPGSQIHAAEGTSPGARGRERSEDPRERLLVYGYIQGEYQVDRSSEDQIGQGNRLLNLDRFVLRRARLIAEREWKYVGGLLELDGNTVNGPIAQVQRAEATLHYRGENQREPYVALTLGQFRTPFGAEQLESPRHRIFMERSTMGQAMFPSEIDAGARLAGALGWFHYAVAATNGQPLGVADSPLQDPNEAKDLSAHLSAVVAPAPSVGLDVGFSALTGRGFHREAQATKDQVQWQDQNANGNFDSGELIAQTGRSASASSNFDRFAFGLDGHARIASRFGTTRVDAELYFASNMDRALYLSDPVLLGRDTRQTGHVVGFTHEVGHGTFVSVFGLRMDYYNPDSDDADVQGTIRVQPYDRSIRTWSPLLGFELEKRARLLFQYDLVRDKLGRDESGVPIDLKNDRMTLRLQVNL